MITFKEFLSEDAKTPPTTVEYKGVDQKVRTFKASPIENWVWADMLKAAEEAKVGVKGMDRMKAERLISGAGMQYMIKKFNDGTGRTGPKFDRHFVTKAWIMSHKVGKLNEAKTAVITAGREVIIGDGDYRQYATVAKIEGDMVYLQMAGRKRLMKVGVDELSVELGRKIVPATVSVSEAKSPDPEMVEPHKYSVKLTFKGKDKRWPALKGDIYEKDVVIGTFSRGAVSGGSIPPIVSKFGSSAAKARFEDFADSLSIAETIEALLPHKMNESVEDDQAELAGEFDKLMAQAKGKLSDKKIAGFKKEFDSYCEAFQEACNDEDDEDGDGADNAIEGMEDLVEEFRDAIKETGK
jgi:ElaB/YqjD/DUF883 family membrane-anchored ribosome-binding protein